MAKIGSPALKRCAYMTWFLEKSANSPNDDEMFVSLIKGDTETDLQFRLKTSTEEEIPAGMRRPLLPHHLTSHPRATEDVYIVRFAPIHWLPVYSCSR